MDDSFNVDDPQTPPKKIKQKHRAQHFRSEWCKNKEFTDWLVPVKEDPLKAKCKICDVTMVAELSNIKNHSKGFKHKRNVISKIKQKPITNFTTNKTETKFDVDVKIAEIKLTAFLAEHNVAFLASDHFTDLLKSCFKDSAIAQNINLKRTKATAIVKNVISASHKSELAEYIKTVPFSILTDESTDIGTVKTACVVLR